MKPCPCSFWIALANPRRMTGRKSLADIRLPRHNSVDGAKYEVSKIPVNAVGMRKDSGDLKRDFNASIFVSALLSSLKKTAVRSMN